MSKRRIAPWFLGLMGVLLALATLATWQMHTARPARDGFPALVVVPFNNLSDDSGLRTFAEGIADDVTTMASRFPDFRIVSSTATAYATDPIEAGRDRGADYLLLGSVQRKGVAVRINAQLVDTQTGRKVWAGCYDGSEMSSLQDAAQADGRSPIDRYTSDSGRCVAPAGRPLSANSGH